MLEMVKNYHRDHGTPVVAFKVDIKGRMTQFLLDVLAAMRFPMKMKNWIKNV